VLALVQPQSSSSDAPNNLRPIYDRVQACMSKSDDDSMLVILDDITILEWIGFPLIDIIHFSRALRALCQKVRILAEKILFVSIIPDII
jgi:hypothetical protein